MSFSQQS
jgi:hypothetical protein